MCGFRARRGAGCGHDRARDRFCLHHVDVERQVHQTNLHIVTNRHVHANRCLSKSFDFLQDMLSPNPKRSLFDTPANGDHVASSKKIMKCVSHCPSDITRYQVFSPVRFLRHDHETANILEPHHHEWR